MSTSRSVAGVNRPDNPVAKSKRLIGDRTFAIVSIAAYGVIIFFVTFHHEPWRDEGDAWLAARDMTLTELFHWSHYTATPLLWYVLLMPLAKGGLPYFSMQLLNAVFTTIAAAIILMEAPFTRVVRLLVCFSYFLGYEYGVIARNYGVLSLLVVLLALSYRWRFQKSIWLGLILAALSNCSMHGLAIAGSFGLAWGIEAIQRKMVSPKVLIGGAVGLAGIVVALAQVLPAAADRQYSDRTTRDYQFVGFAVQRAGFPWLPADLGKHRGTVMTVGVYTLRAISLVALACVAYALRRNVPLLIGLATALGALEYIFVFGWYGGNRHSGMIWLAVLAACWIAKRTNPGPWSMPAVGRWAIALCLIESSAAAAAFWYLDWRYPYSGSTATAAFLSRELKPDDIVVALSEKEGDCLLPYLPGRRFWYPGRETFSSYGLFDVAYVTAFDLKAADALKRARARFPVDHHFVFVSSERLVDPQNWGLQPIFQIPDGFMLNDTERFHVYRGAAAARP